MDTLKTVVVAGVTACLVAGAIILTNPGDTTILPVRSEGERVGALSSPDIPYNYLVVGGVPTYYSKTTSLIQATSSVICSIQSPSATSTLVDGSIQISSASTTGTTPLTISKSSVPYTIDKVIATASVVEDSNYFLQAASSTYNAAALADRVFPGNSYFVVSQTGGGTLTQSGTCQAVFRPAY